MGAAALSAPERARRARPRPSIVAYAGALQPLIGGSDRTRTESLTASNCQLTLDSLTQHIHMKLLCLDLV